MPLMLCQPGTGLWTLGGRFYTDVGVGEVEVDSTHVAEAVLAGWVLSDETEEEESVAPEDPEATKKSAPRTR